MSQLIEITASSGLSGLVGRLFANGSDTVAATASSVTEATNRKSVYTATFTGVTVGTYQLLLLDADSLPVASRSVRITASSGTFTEIDDEQAVLDVLGAPAGASIAADIAAIEGGAIEGDNEITAIVTDFDTDDPIENATVRYYRTGEAGGGALQTDENGERVFGLNTAVWKWIVSAPGYTTRTGTLPVDGDDTHPIQLESVIVTTPEDPNHANLQVTCIGADSALEPDAVIVIRMVKPPANEEGFGYDGSESTFTANASGVASREVIRLATYEIRREGAYKQWQRVLIPDEDLVQVNSFVQQ
jgi:hypothetical protein